MTDDQRKAVALEYLLRIDRGSGDFLEMFDTNAQCYLPKWGVARGVKEIEQMFNDLGKLMQSIEHHNFHFNYIIQGDMVVLEGTTAGVTASGKNWRAGVGHAGYWCDVFEIRNFKIQRLSIYIDPDYEGADTARYPWLSADGQRA
jgi:ketosteroid isomerase-like protein